MCRKHRKKFVVKATTYDVRGRPIAVAYNSYTRTHPRQAELAARVGTPERQTLHAEVAAIIRSKRTPISKIRIERYDVDGHPKTAKPCLVCELAIKEAGIGFIEYTIG